MTTRLEMKTMSLLDGNTITIDGYTFPKDGFVAVYDVVDKVKPDHLHPEELLNGNYAVINKEKTIKANNK